MGRREPDNIANVKVGRDSWDLSREELRIEEGSCILLLFPQSFDHASYTEHDSRNSFKLLLFI